MKIFIAFTFTATFLITLGMLGDGLQISRARRRRYISDMDAQISKMKNCDPTTIPVMDVFNISQFLGKWYELGKTMSNYIDVNDGVWEITNSETKKFKFLYSGRGSDEHCVRPIAGTLHQLAEYPSELVLHYRTFTTNVSEKVRVLYTDYTSIAVLYSCVHTIDHTGGCHPAGVLGSLWTREPHVDGNIYYKALSYLEKACIDQQTIRIRNIVGPCEIDESGKANEDESDLVHDICYQPMKAGSCFATTERFYYDKNEKQCKQFQFTGCNGNKNNFFSLQDCEQHCLNIGEKKLYIQCPGVSECALHCPPCCHHQEDGCVVCSCESIIIDGSFECQTMRCPDNCRSTEIYADCYKCICDEVDDIDKQSVCLEVKQTGTCDKEIERYYYNAIHNECEKFIFSGCGGNKNHFETIEECHSVCQIDHGLVLKQPMDSLDPDGAITTNGQMALLIISHVFIIFHYKFLMI